eukprot:ANDGO_04228.mRNA.1 Zinc finger protein bud20
MGRLARTRHHVNDKGHSRGLKAKNRTPDADQVEKYLEAKAKGIKLPTLDANAHNVLSFPTVSMSEKKMKKLTDAQVELGRDFDLPGGGMHLCPECSRYFIDADALVTHNKSKQHKQRVRQIRNTPAYTLEESRGAAGHGSYHKPTKSTGSAAEPME